MIFVTIGTHEQNFDRLVQEVVSLKVQNIISEDLLIQFGFSTPINSVDGIIAKKLLSANEMISSIQNCTIPITHGGPATFISCLNEGKIPIVVPRLVEFDEHVNNHQLDFCEKLIDESFPIILVKNIDELKHAISNYKEMSEVCANKEGNSYGNTEKFTLELISEVKKMFEEN